MKNIKLKAALVLLVLFVFFIPCNTSAKVKAPKKECHAYVVMDAGSGEVLFGQDADKQIYPASTAKIMTAIVCVEKEKDLNRKVKTDYDVVHGTTIGTYCLGIGANVTYTIKDLMAMSLISSAADATDCLAVAVFGSKAKCVEAMNAKCEELGLTQTHFDNPVGSDIGAGFKETYATATEMAKITRYAMTKTAIRDLVKRRSYSPSGRDITANTTNWFLRGMAYYNKDAYTIIGTKSGTTNAAGHVFIATAVDKEGHEVICAYFGNVSKESTFASIRSLYDYTFKQYKKGKLTLTPSNYDVRCSGTFGDVYSKYAALNCYPGEKDYRFHWSRAITRSELGKMLKAILERDGNAVITSFVKGNKKGKITALDLAELTQKLYPQHLSKTEVDEILADCSKADELTEEQREAFAIFLKNALNPDKYCKNPKQIIHRKEAVLYADLLRSYQQVYELTHWNVLGSPTAGDDNAIEDNHFCGGITIVRDELAEALETYHAEKEAEREAKAAEKAAKEAAEKAAAEAATAETGTTEASPEATEASPEATTSQK